MEVHIICTFASFWNLQQQFWSAATQTSSKHQGRLGVEFSVSVTGVYPYLQKWGPNFGCNWKGRSQFHHRPCSNWKDCAFQLMSNNFFCFEHFWQCHWALLGYDQPNMLETALNKLLLINYSCNLQDNTGFSLKMPRNMWLVRIQIIIISTLRSRKVELWKIAIAYKHQTRLKDVFLE